MPTINDYDSIRHPGVHAAVLPIAGQADLPALTVCVERPHDDYLRMAPARQDGFRARLADSGGHYGADHHPQRLQTRLVQALHERCRGCFAHG
jgi:hypothetical protein